MAKPWQTRLRKLGQRKWRQRYQEAPLEGIRLVETALEHRAPLLAAWYAPDLHTRPGGQDVLDRLGTAGVKVFGVGADELKKVASVETSQGLIATMALVEPPLTTGGDLWVVVDGVQDPGNLGTIIRSAAAADVDGMFLLPGTVDLHNPKTLRAAMGAAFQFPIHTVASFPGQVLPFLRSEGAQIAVADVGGQLAPREVDFTGKVALIIGNEGWGPSEEVKSHADWGVRIPMPGGAESLNVAMATTVLLYEVVRQRSLVW